MKKLTFLVILMLTGLTLLSGEESKAEAIFLDVHSKILSALPDSFNGRLKAKSVEKNLKNIPKSSYIDPKKDIYVEVAYSKKSGVEFNVKNVDELYKDMYRNLPRQIFAFDLLLAKTDTNTLRKYDISIEHESENTTILKLNVRNSENKVLLYVDNRINKILRIDYEIGKDLLNSTIIIYRDIDKYSIPYKFISKSFNKGTSTVPEIYEIDNIQIK
ncbi:MAG: hypothetical protein ACP5QT_05300 [Brevinematia bacterium]